MSIWVKSVCALMLQILVPIVAVSCGVPDGNEPDPAAVTELEEENGRWQVGIRQK